MTRFLSILCFLHLTLMAAVFALNISEFTWERVHSVSGKAQCWCWMMMNALSLPSSISHRVLRRFTITSPIIVVGSAILSLLAPTTIQQPPSCRIASKISPYGKRASDTADSFPNSQILWPIELDPQAVCVSITVCYRIRRESHNLSLKLIDPNWN